MKKYFLLVICAVLALCSCTKNGGDKDGYLIFDGQEYTVSSLVYQANSDGWTELYFYGGRLKIDINGNKKGSGPQLWMSMFHFENGEYDSVYQAYFDPDYKPGQIMTKLNLTDVAVKIDIDPRNGQFTMDMKAQCDGKSFILHSTGVKQEHFI